VRIGLFSQYFTPEIGAPSARILELGREWVRRGHELQVVTCFPNHPTGNLYPGYRGGRYLFEEIEGIRVHRHWTYRAPNRGFLKKTLGHFSYLPAARLFSSPRLETIDVAVGTSPTFFAAMAAKSGAKRFAAPFVMEVRDLWPAIFVDLGVITSRRVIRLLEAWELALYRAATRVVTVTESFRENLIARGVPAEKVVTIRNGADVEFWRPLEDGGDLRRSLKLAPDAFVVLYIGAHGISHGLEAIVDAADRLRTHPDIQFLFVGEGARKRSLMEEARSRGLANLHFLDPVDKAAVRGFYALSDVCLVPLRNVPLFDSFIPSKMFEMMAMGRPIVGSVRGEAARILEESGSALVVAPEDSGAISDAVLRLYQSAELRGDLGARGREYVVRHYSRSHLAERYLGVLEDAVSSLGNVRP
jgi:glycosyltransferase involved in cell wall biosynthesis